MTIWAKKGLRVVWQKFWVKNLEKWHLFTFPLIKTKFQWWKQTQIQAFPTYIKSSFKQYKPLTYPKHTYLCQIYMYPSPHFSCFHLLACCPVLKKYLKAAKKKTLFYGPDRPWICPFWFFFFFRGKEKKTLYTNKKNTRKIKKETECPFSNGKTMQLDLQAYFVAIFLLI